MEARDGIEPPLFKVTRRSDSAHPKIRLDSIAIGLPLVVPSVRELPLEAKIAEARKFEATYSNPLYRAAMTVLEPLPVGIVMALVTAGILRRKPEDGMPSAASPEALTN